jgi:3-hydroxyisobutyrate dehydrogenase
VFNKVKPILEGMGKSIFNCDKVGAGQIAKVCNNMALAI